MVRQVATDRRARQLEVPEQGTASGTVLRVPLDLGCRDGIDFVVEVGLHAERFSAPFFFNPAYSAAYAPLQSTVDSRHPPRYRPIVWREFRARRAAGDYADHGEYAQISDYRS